MFWIANFNFVENKIFWIFYVAIRGFAWRVESTHREQLTTVLSIQQIHIEKSFYLALPPNNSSRQILNFSRKCEPNCPFFRISCKCSCINFFKFSVGNFHSPNFFWNAKICRLLQYKFGMERRIFNYFVRCIFAIRFAIAIFPLKSAQHFSMCFQQLQPIDFLEVHSWILVLVYIYLDTRFTQTERRCINSNTRTNMHAWVRCCEYVLVRTNRFMRFASASVCCQMPICWGSIGPAAYSNSCNVVTAVNYSGIKST